MQESLDQREQALKTYSKLLEELPQSPRAEMVRMLLASLSSPTG